MSESPSFRLDQTAPAASQYGERFTAPAFTQPETAEDFLSDNATNIEQAASDVQQAYEAASPDEKLVFADRRGNFEVRQQQPAVAVETTMLDDSYAEMVRARQEAAARQAEHAAIEAENVRAIAATGQIIGASRDYAEHYGLAA